MPKKAVAIFFLSAFVGAAIFTYITFPRTRDQIPRSNNQRPFPSAPAQMSNVAVPSSAPAPELPQLPAGPALRVLAWASGDELSGLNAEADAFSAASGRHAALTVAGDEATYERDVKEALASDSPPDVCLVDARDFSGLDPARDLASVTPDATAVPRGVAAFTADSEVKALADEFTVQVLFYNPNHFDQAAIGYPDRHWNWDVLEAITRALASLKLKDASGRPVYPLEMSASFDLWNLLSAQAGGPALDLDQWHVGEAGGREAQTRGLDLIHEFFQGLAVLAPQPSAGAVTGEYFAQERASLLVGSSDLAAALPKFGYRMTFFPRDVKRCNVARVNGWAVTARSTNQDAARELAAYLARQPVHAGWSPIRAPSDPDESQQVCAESFETALIPRLDAKSALVAEAIDEEIKSFARDPRGNSAATYARIQADSPGNLSVPVIESAVPAGK